jgi:acyl-CoA dehydrogenase
MGMADRSFLDWPFFEDRHRDLAARLEAWCAVHLPVDHADIDAACRGLVAALGAGGWLRHSAAGEGERLDVRTVCLIREGLARHDALADFAFAMQGLGMGAVTLFGTTEQRQWLARTRAEAGKRTASNLSRASGWGAITSIRSATVRPGAPAGTRKAVSPLAPGPSPVRAKTVQMSAMPPLEI